MRQFGLTFLGLALVFTGCGGDSGGDTTNACGGTMVLTGTPGDPCGACGSGTYACSGMDAVICNGEFSTAAEVVATDTGATVEASTVFSDDFPVNLSIDGDLTTSWFSSGPEGDNSPTEYTWTGTVDRCITSVDVLNNDMHANEAFRSGFGFGEIGVQLLDAAGAIVASDTVSVLATPDPDVTFEFENGQTARSVRILMNAHESEDCGGFSELQVNVVN